jgi:hypothetical protein
MRGYERGSIGRIRDEKRASIEAKREAVVMKNSYPCFQYADGPSSSGVLFTMMAPTAGAIIAGNICVKEIEPGASLLAIIDNNGSIYQTPLLIEDGKVSVPQRVELNRGDILTITGNGMKRVWFSFLYEMG